MGAVAAVALMAAATAAPAPPRVELAADTTVLAVCGATCPQWPDDDLKRILDEFVTPFFPVADGDELTPVAVRAKGEAWPLNGILRLLGVAVGDPRLADALLPDQPWWKLTGLFDLTGDQSIRAGATALEQAIAAATPGNRVVIYGLSQGATSVNSVRDRITAQYPDGTSAPDIDFILEGDARVPNGGLLSRFPGFYLPILDWTFNGPEPTDTQFDTVVVNRQYDGFADFPIYPLNLVATLNAVLGIVYLHTWPFGLDIPTDDPTSSPGFRGTDGRTSYYLFDSPDLPLFAPLRTLGVPEKLIDIVEPFFRVIVELGYDRSIEPWVPAPARLIPRLDPAEVINDLGDAIGEGIANARALFAPKPETHVVDTAVEFDEPTVTTRSGVDPVETNEEQRIEEQRDAFMASIAEESAPDGRDPLDQADEQTGQDRDQPDVGEEGQVALDLPSEGQDAQDEVPPATDPQAADHNQDLDGGEPAEPTA